MDYSDLDELVDDTETPAYEEFALAAEYLAKNHSNLLPDVLLELYAFYKQGTAGDCNTSKPGIFNIQSRAKWNAWNDLRGMTKEQARIKYVEKILSHFPQWKQTTKSAGWVAVSTQLNYADSEQAEDTLADFIRNNDLAKAENVLSLLKPGEINELDADGIGLIHWCTDRGHVDILEMLIRQPGIDLNLQDIDGQTALHYASYCGHVECLKLLIKVGANRNVPDYDGNLFVDVAYDDTTKLLIQSLN